MAKEAKLSTPLRSCISLPERKYINEAGKKAPELGAFCLGIRVPTQNFESQSRVNLTRCPYARARRAPIPASCATELRRADRPARAQGTKSAIDDLSSGY